MIINEIPKTANSLETDRGLQEGGGRARGAGRGEAAGLEPGPGGQGGRYSESQVERDVMVSIS